MDKRYLAEADNGSGLTIRSAVDLTPGQVYLSKAGVPLEYPPSPNGLHDYIIQAHFRGKSVHLDLRILRDKDYAEGWTILGQQSGILAEPVTTLAAAKKWACAQRLWKFSLKTGKIMPRKIETTIQGRKRTIVRPGSLQATRKVGLIPKEWMKLEGVVPAGKDVPGEPIPAGATAQYPGVFVIIDKGKLTFGARKPNFFEYFIEQGRLLSGRIVFRLVSRTQVRKDSAWEQFRMGELFYEPEIGIVKQVLPPGKEPEAAREKTFWLFMTLDTEPYVLGSDAVKKGWLSPKGVAALPQDFQSKAPAELRYWKMKDTAKQSEARKGLVNFFREKPVAKQEADKEFSEARLFCKEEGTGLWRMAPSKIPIAQMRFVSKSTKKQIVFGVVLFPEEYGKDKQNDTIPREEVELAAYRYLAFGRQVGFFHKGTPVPAFPVANDVAHTDFLLDKKNPKSLVKEGEWYIGVWLPRPEDWARVESGEVTGFSIEGKAQRERV